MAMQIFEVSSNMEWDNPPSYYYTDPDFYMEKRAEVIEALEKIGANYAMFWWYGEPQAAGFAEESEEQSEETIEDNGELFEYVQEDHLGARWQGPHIKIFKDGAVQVKFQSKHTDDECWVDII